MTTSFFASLAILLTCYLFYNLNNFVLSYTMALYTDHRWPGGTRLNSIRTHRGTLVEMAEHPKWGVTCYMDGEIQSCESDEAIYHASLVHPAMESVETPRRVLIVGGGEGATAREVLKWPVTRVDMVEWDRDVLRLFKKTYRQWAKGAWEDPRLHLRTEDIMDVIDVEPTEPYDVILIDLFDPTEETREQWKEIFIRLSEWLAPGGSLMAYAGMKGALSLPTWELCEWVEGVITRYDVTIPSFEGVCEFIGYRATGVFHGV